MGPYGLAPFVVPNYYPRLPADFSCRERRFLLARLPLEAPGPYLRRSSKRPFGNQEPLAAGRARPQHRAWLLFVGPYDDLAVYDGSGGGLGVDLDHLLHGVQVGADVFLDEPDRVRTPLTLVVPRLTATAVKGCEGHARVVTSAMPPDPNLLQNVPIGGTLRDHTCTPEGRVFVIMATSR